MVSFVLMSIGMLGLTATYLAQVKTKKDLDQQGIARVIVSGTLRVVMDDESQFPFLQKTGSFPMYVGCFLQTGQQAPYWDNGQVQSTIDYWLTFLSDETQVFKRASPLICDVSQFELHVAFPTSQNTGGAGTVTLQVVALFPGAAGAQVRAVSDSVQINY